MFMCAALRVHSSTATHFSLRAHRHSPFRIPHPMTTITAAAAVPWRLLLAAAIIICRCSAFSATPPPRLLRRREAPNARSGRGRSSSSPRRLEATAAAAAAAVAVEKRATVDAISVTVPPDWQTCGDDAWCAEAASVLDEFGAVVLTAGRSGGGGLISRGTCDGADEAASSRVEEMHRRISNRGLDPTGAEGPYRFAEIVCRDEGGRRFDVPVPWLGDDGRLRGAGTTNGGGGEAGGGRVGAPLRPEEEGAMSRLHRSMMDLASPVVDALWSKKGGSRVAAAGFLMNRPGSTSQDWHRDGPDEGYVDCFVPLIDLDETLGPTAIRPGTHTDKAASRCSDGGEEDGASNVLVPMLKKGEVLLFDYRTVHRGQANTSERATRTLAYAVFRRREEGGPPGGAVGGGDIHNFPAALTLEYD